MYRGVQTYGGVQTYRECPNIWGAYKHMGVVQTYGVYKHRGCPDIQGSSKCMGGIKTYGGVSKHMGGIWTSARGHVCEAGNMFQPAVTSAPINPLWS